MDLHLPWPVLRPLVLSLSIVAGLASGVEAQPRSDCRSPQPRSVGVAFGRSLPYVELASGGAGAPAPGSVYGGAQFAGRVDLPVTGPLRLRIEGATARWDVRRKTYDAGGFTVIEDTSIGHMSSRHLVALAGLRMGRPPACAHVLAGGGLYAIGFERVSMRRAGASLAAGIEIPTGDRGAIQVDAVLHLIGTRDSHPIAMTTVATLNLLVGWAYRF